MANIPISLFPDIPAQNSNSPQKSQVAQPGQFGSLLADAGTKAAQKNTLAGDFLGNIINSLSTDIGSIFFPEAASGKFPFNQAFQSTFGLSGPLPAYINVITQKLNLSVAQNQALQDIAVENKDITNTPDNVKKLAAELEKAGINA